MRRRGWLTAWAAAFGGSVAAILYHGDEINDYVAQQEPKGASDADSDSAAGGDGRVETTTAPSPDAVAAAVAERINAVRKDERVVRVRRDSDLRLVAREHSRDMDTRDFYAHKNPDGEQPWDRAPCDGAGEVLHRGTIGTVAAGGESYDTTTADGLAAYIVDEWARSDSHFRELVRERYERVGVGIHINGTEWWATGLFC